MPISDRVDWILKNSCQDENYRANIPRLTDEELKYCLEHETRTTGRKQLERELRKREGERCKKL